MFSFLIVILLGSCQSAFAINNITLNTTNNVVLRGEINQDVIDNVLYQLMTNNPEYLYINSNGGSVMAGNRLVQYLKYKEIKCIAEKAYSMAFVILQACKYRYATQQSTAMQHQQSLRIGGELLPIMHYLDMVNAMENDLNKLQAERIGMKEQKFRELTTNEWWVYGTDIIDNGIADDIAYVNCTSELVKSNTTTIDYWFFQEIKTVFSKCPLITQPIETNYKDL